MKQISFGREHSGSEIVAALRSVAASTESCSFDYVPERVYLRSRMEKEVFSDLRLIVGGNEIRILGCEEETLQGDARYPSITLETDGELDEEDFEKRLLEALERGPTRDVGRPVKEEEELQRRELTSEDLERVDRGEMTILALVQGEYGERIANNVRENGPDGFEVLTMTLPEDLPTVVDDPAEHLPESVPQADLVLALQESASAAQLISEVVRLAGAKALIAPVDNSQYLPHGMRTQIERELSRVGVAVAFPRPFCTLEPMGEPIIDKFVEYFGRPALKLKVEKDAVTAVEVVRDSPCGCGRFVAKELPGTKVREAIERAGLLHHHYPCLCSMNVEDDLEDTLMHVSGLQMKKTVDKSFEPIRKKEASYLDPTQM